MDAGFADQSHLDAGFCPALASHRRHDAAARA